MNQLLARSAELEARIAAFLGLPLFDDSSRLRAVRSVASLGFEHAQSLKYLTAAGLCTSAAALLRVQYESLVRAIWTHHCATDHDVELILAELTRETAKQASKIPMLSKMLDEIEAKAPHVPVASLREFKHYSWKPLSSYVQWWYPCGEPTWAGLSPGARAHADPAFQRSLGASREFAIDHRRHTRRSWCYDRDLQGIR